jgi:hypothetical protein
MGHRVAAGFPEATFQARSSPQKPSFWVEGPWRTVNPAGIVEDRALPLPAVTNIRIKTSLTRRRGVEVLVREA